MASVLYSFEIPLDDVGLYAIEYTPISLPTRKIALVALDSELLEETVLFTICSSTFPVFYLRRNLSVAIDEPVAINNLGSCDIEPEPVEPDPIDPDPFTLTLIANPTEGGTVNDVQGLGEYVVGDLVQVEATPSTGYLFSNWSEAGVVLSTNPTYNFSMPSRNLTLTASFVLEPEPPQPQPPLPPTSYDTECQRFVLIRNPSTVILPEDVIDLNTFSDKFLLEDEPEGFDSATINLTRDLETHGLNYEYSLEFLNFACDYGKDYLRTIHEEDGTDADVKLVYGIGTLEDFSVLYVGRLDFNEYAIENAEYVKMNLRKDDFRSVLQTAFEIPQEIVPDKEVLLYSKVIPKKITYTIPQPDQVVEGVTSYPRAFKDPSTGTFIGRESPVQYILVNDGKEGDTDAQIFPTYDFQIDPNFPVTDGAGFKYLFRAKEAGLYKIHVQTTLRFNISSIEGWGADTVFDIVTLDYLTTEPDGITPRGSATQVQRTAITSLNPLGRSEGGHIEIEFDEQIERFVNVEECFYLYFTLDSPRIRSQRTFAGSGVEARPFKGDINTPQITIVAETLAPASKSNFISPLDAFNTVFKEASEVNYDLVKSTFLSESCGANLYLTNGFNVRGFVEDDRNIVKLSPKGVFDQYKDIFNLGWGVEYSPTKEELVRVEPAEYFYQDTKILDLDSDLISDYEVSVDNTIYYNEIEVGFKNYSKIRETDKGNTLDDFHTKHTYQTPIKTNKKKLTVLSDMTLSGYELEILRRKQFSKEGSNENANFREDENIFGVQLLNDQFYSGQVFKFFLTDLSDGDIMFISSNSVVVVGYAYFYQGQIVNVRVDDKPIRQNSILNIEYGLFRPVGFGFDVQGTRIVFNNALDQSDAPFNINLSITTVNGERYLVPESNQPFENVSNLVSPQSAYNLRYTPKRMLLNWAKMFNGGFRSKADSEEIVFKQGDGNISLSTRFNNLDQCRLGDDQRDTIVERGNLRLDSTFSRDTLFFPYKVRFSYPLSFGELNYIRRAMRGISEDSNNYGYIEYVNPLGNTERIFITNIEFNPSQEEAIVEGYLKEFSI